jgi:hypothetical protein
MVELMRKPILLVGGASVSSIFWTLGFIFLGALIMLAILIALAIFGWRVAL